MEISMSERTILFVCLHGAAKNGGGRELSMPSSTVSRRGVLTAALAGWAGSTLVGPRRAWAASTEIKMPDSLPVERVDFETAGIDGWNKVAGQWAVEEMDGAPSGRRVLVQRATSNAYNVIVAPFGPYTDVDVSMKFKPISGREDASGGIVFRFPDGRYYVVRANALETTSVFTTTTATAVSSPPRASRPQPSEGGTRSASWPWPTTCRPGQRHPVPRSSRFAVPSGRPGLWTKADSITAFDDLTVRGATTER